MSAFEFSGMEAEKRAGSLQEDELRFVDFEEVSLEGGDGFAEG